MSSNTQQGYAFYGSQYARFGTAVAAEIRREVYGIDIGQQGWRSMDEQSQIIEIIQKRICKDVLDVACGSGGPSLAIAQATGCKLTGVDFEKNAIVAALGFAASLSKADSTQFIVADCGKKLPFPDASFDAIVCIDAILHFADRMVVINDWHRLLRPKGILLFADAAVVTGAISKEEIDIRASQGTFVCVPTGYNEAALANSGFHLIDLIDTTRVEAEIASRLLEARERHRELLIIEEGAEWFENRQKFLSVTSALANDKKLSRYFYVASKQ